MTEHLPECKWHEFQCWCCICDELRACEERVAEETEAAMMKFFYWKPSPPHDQHYFADNICAYCVGYREAFTAARKAVAALRGCIGTDGSGDGTVWVEKADALDAIDALREASDD